MNRVLVFRVDILFGIKLSRMHITPLSKDEDNKPTEETT
jgi:hypothetical protein